MCWGHSGWISLVLNIFVKVVYSPNIVMGKENSPTVHCDCNGFCNMIFILFRLKCVTSTDFFLSANELFSKTFLDCFKCWLFLSLMWQIKQEFHSSGLMTDVDLDPSCTLNKKIRNAQLAQYNFILGQWQHTFVSVLSVIPVLIAFSLTT